MLVIIRRSFLTDNSYRPYYHWVTHAGFLEVFTVTAGILKMTLVMAVAGESREIISFLMKGCHIIRSAK